MRAILLSFLLSACASSSNGRYVNVAVVRHEIRSAIDADISAHHAASRWITSMGHVEKTLAVVFTERKDGARQEETWIRAGDRWQLKDAKAVAASTTPPSNTN